MKTKARVVSFLIAMLMVLMSLSVCILPVGADNTSTSQTADDEVRYTKKVVSVLFDTSGSMNNTSDHRNEYALYAIQMLMSLLGKNDQLIITPMTGSDKQPVTLSQLNVGVEVDLAAEDRDAEIKRVMNTSFLANTPNGSSTPAGSVTVAREQLVKRGLMNSQDLANAEPGVEHWLVVLTDGGFNGADADDPDNVMIKNMADYPSMKAIYIAFGSSAIDIRGSNSIKNYPCTPYAAERASDIATVMRDVANQLLGRVPFEDSEYGVSYATDSSGNTTTTVTVDLSGKEVSYKNIAVIAQNCDADLRSVKYNGDANKIKISHSSVITPAKVLKEAPINMKNGLSAVIERNSAKDDEYFSGGTLELVFDGSVKKEDIGIFGEPALIIAPYIIYKGKQESVDYMSSNLIAGDVVRIGYNVYDNVDDQANQKPLDLEAIYGASKVEIKYAGENYGLDKDITLKFGNHAITISISLMDEKYKITKTLPVLIVNYSVEVDAAQKEIPFDTGEQTATFTAYVNKAALSKSEITDKSKYQISVTLKTPDNRTIDIPYEVGTDGSVTAKVAATSGVYGTYTVTFTLSDEFGKRSAECAMEYKQGDLKLEGEAIAETNSHSLVKAEYSVYMNGRMLDKAALNGFTIKATVAKSGEAPVDLPVQIESNGKLICAPDVEKRDYGEYEITLTVDAGNGIPPQSDTYTIRYSPEKVEITEAHPQDPGKGNAKFNYTVLVDGEQLTKAELEKYGFMVTITLPGDKVVNVDCQIDENGNVTADFDRWLGDPGGYVVEAKLNDASLGDPEPKRYTIANFPDQIEVKVKNGELSMTEYGLGSNDKAFEFTLYADGEPFPIINGLTKYKVTVGNVDVTQYTTYEDNILRYVPVATQFEGQIPKGNTRVTVTFFEEKEDPQRTPLFAETGPEVVLKISDTVYSIVAIDAGNRHVDRFKIKDTDAVIYFKVLRDGDPLPLDMLEEAYQKGDFQIKDEKGTFSWKFWFSCGSEVSVETLNNEAVVAFRVKRDHPAILSPVSSFMAMHIRTGDKPITASYNGATLTESITFDASNPWSFIWRTLVYLAIVHILHWAAGFINGKCKSLPSGLLVSASIVSDTASVSFATIKVNNTFWKKYSWHLKRLFLVPVNKKILWYHQPPKSYMGNVKATFQISTSGSPVFCLKEMKYELDNSDNGTEQAEKITNFESALTNRTIPRTPAGINGEAVRNYYRLTSLGDPLLPGINAPYLSYYGTVNNNNELSTMFYFVKRRF